MKALSVALEYAKKPNRMAKWRSMKWLLKHPTIDYSPFPLQGKVEITRRCNLNCGMCLRSHLPIYPDMTEAQFELVLEKLKNLVVFQPHGYGEPLMHPKFERFMEIVTAKHMAIHLVTNGLLLNESLADAFLQHCKPLKITYSIDAADKETYEKIRVGGNFYDLLWNMRHVVGYKKLWGLNTHLNWYCTLADYNFDQAEKIVRLASEIGLDSVNFTDLTLHGYGLATQNHDIRHKKDIESRLETLEILKVKTAIPVYYLVEKRASCNLPWVQIFVQADGEVFPCTDTLGYSLGNLFEQTLDEVWNGKAMREFRKDFYSNPTKECKKCVMYGGGENGLD